MIPNHIINSFYYREARILNKARVVHLDTLQLDFSNKTILETGCGGVGDITSYLLEKNAIVTLNDYRQENIQSLLLNINKDLPYNNWDLNEHVSFDNKFDIVVCYGTLYHLTKLETAFQNLANLCKDYTIISTQTSGKNDDQINILYEGGTNEQSSNSYGCRPGRLLVWNELKKNFKYVYCVKTQPDNVDYPLQFPSDNSSSRNIFIGSHIELNNDKFVSELLNSYTI